MEKTLLTILFIGLCSAASADWDDDHYRRETLRIQQEMLDEQRSDNYDRYMDRMEERQRQRNRDFDRQFKWYDRDREGKY